MKFLEDQTLTEEAANKLDEMLKRPAKPRPVIRSPRMKKAKGDIIVKRLNDHGKDIRTQ